MTGCLTVRCRVVAVSVGVDLMGFFIYLFTNCVSCTPMLQASLQAFAITESYSSQGLEPKMNMSNSVTLQVIEHTIIREVNKVVCTAHNLVEFTDDGVFNHL